MLLWTKTTKQKLMNKKHSLAIMPLRREKLRLIKTMNLRKKVSDLANFRDHRVCAISRL